MDKKPVKNIKKVATYAEARKNAITWGARVQGQSVATAALIYKRGDKEHEFTGQNTICHAFLRGGWAGYREGNFKMVEIIDFVHRVREPDLMKPYMQYVQWAVNEGPFAGVASRVSTLNLEKYGVRYDPNKHSNQKLLAAITFYRQFREFPKSFRAYLDLRKAGLSELMSSFMLSLYTPRNELWTVGGMCISAHQFASSSRSFKKHVQVYKGDLSAMDNQQPMGLEGTAGQFQDTLFGQYGDQGEKYLGDVAQSYATKHKKGKLKDPGQRRFGEAVDVNSYLTTADIVAIAHKIEKEHFNG